MELDIIGTLLGALPDVTVEAPFPAFEQIAGNDVNLGSSFGDTNLPFGNDAFDIEIVNDNSTTTDESTNVSDILDVNLAEAGE